MSRFSYPVYGAFERAYNKRLSNLPKRRYKALFIEGRIRQCIASSHLSKATRTLRKLKRLNIK